VGCVVQEESTIICANRDYDPLGKSLASNSLAADQIEVQADRYQFRLLLVASGCGRPELTKIQAPPEADYLQRELHRLAEAVLVALDPDVDLAAADGED
jgi:hypothetical protein